MATSKISGMPVATSLSGTEDIEVVQGGISKRATTRLIADLADGVGRYTRYTRAIDWWAAATSTTSQTSYGGTIVVSYPGTSVTRSRMAWALPKRWDLGTVSFKVFGVVDTGGSAGHQAVWKMAAKAISAGDAMPTTANLSTGAQSAIMVWTANDDLLVSAESAAITVDGSPTAGDLVVWDFWRDYTNSDDNSSAPFILIGVEIYWTASASDDT